MPIATIPSHPAPMYVSAPVYVIPAKLVRDTVYMPSHVAARTLGRLVTPRQSAPTDPDPLTGD